MSKFANTRPNVLLFVTDQQRYDTLGCYGNPYVDTPNLDKFAKSGILFNRAYCQTPICTPSRASFLTGRYPRTTRCRQNGQLIPADERLVSKALTENGYYCSLVGKLHLGPCAPKACPIMEERIDDGFTEFHWSHNPSGIGNNGLPESGGTYWTGNEYSHWLFKRGAAYVSHNYDEKGYVKVGMDEENHATTWCADKVIDWIRYSAAEKKAIGKASPPWFYNANIFDPHHAFDPPKRLLEKYLARLDKLPLPRFMQGEWDQKTVFQKLDHKNAYNMDYFKDHFQFDNMNDYEHKLIKAAYYAMIELIDIQFGRIIQALEETDTLKDTLIIFTSDHGEMLGDHGIYLKGPYFYEQMSHIPLIISWKDHLPEGVVLDSLVELTDLVPTIEEYCLGYVEPGVQGKSLAALMEGEIGPDEHRDSVYCEYYNAMPWHQSPKAFGTMVYDGRYKLSRYHSSDEGELYDLQEDPDEFVNLWDDPRYSQIKMRLLVLLSDRMAQTVDPLPVRLDKW